MAFCRNGANVSGAEIKKPGKKTRALNSSTSKRCLSQFTSILLWRLPIVSRDCDVLKRFVLPETSEIT
jgi:hypothetical protein